MTKNTFLANSLTNKELRWGLRYLLFELIFLPEMLNALNWALGVPMNLTVFNFLYFSINFIVVILLFKSYLSRFLAVEWEQIGRIVLTAGIVFCIYEATSLGLGWIISRLRPDFANVNDQSVTALTRENFLLMLLGTVLLVPVAEETLFRGLIFRGLYDRSPKAAWIISVAGFALIHITNFIGIYPIDTLLICYLQYIPAGICLAVAYRLTGSIFTPILIHSVVNLVGILALR